MATINKIHPKYTGGETPPAATPTPNPPVTTDWAIEKKQRFEQLLTEYEAVMQYEADLSLEDVAKLKATVLMIKADIELLDHFIETGEWLGDDAGVEAPQTPSELEQQIIQELSDADPGWQGNIDIKDKDGNPLTDDEDRALVGDDYAGTIMVRQGGYDAADPTLSSGVALIMTDDMKSVTGKTVGSDIWVTVENMDGTKKVYVLKNMSVRTAEPIAIYAGNLTHHVTIDMSGVFRISNGQYGPAYGSTNGVWIIGTNVDDEAVDFLIGSQGSDFIVGGAGNDRIYGMAGDDVLFGDGVQEDPKGEGGDDYIDGGLGSDTVDGGGGGDDTAIVEDGEKPLFVENTKTAEKDQQYEVLDNTKKGEIIGDQTDGWTSEVTNNEIVLSRDPNFTARSGEPEDGVIEINMPTYLDANGERHAYTFAQAEQEGKDLILVCTAIDAITKKIRMIRIHVKNFFDDDNKTKLIINSNGLEPNIVDMLHSFGDPVNSGSTMNELDFGWNSVTLNGAPGLSDVLVAPRNNMDIFGVDINSIDHRSSYDQNQLDELIDEVFNKTEDVPAEDEDEEPTTETSCVWGYDDLDIWGEGGASSQNGMIVIDYDSEKGTDAIEDEDKRILEVEPPDAGFDRALMQRDANGRDLYIIFINVATKEKIVVKIVNGQQMLDDDNWKIMLNNYEIGEIPNGDAVMGITNIVNGDGTDSNGSGADLLFGSRFSSQLNDGDDAGDYEASGEFDDSAEVQNGPLPETQDPIDPEEGDSGGGEPAA